MHRPESNTLYLTKKIIILTSVTVKHPDKEKSLMIDILLYFVFIKIKEFFSRPSKSTKSEVKNKIHSI
jgi:hypothetical protein